MIKKLCLILSSIGLALCCLGCSPNVKTESEVHFVNEVSENIFQLKQKGFFDNILSNYASRSINELTDEEIRIQRFITDTDDVLNEIIQNENGDIELTFIDAIFNKGTIQDVYEALCFDSESLADQFINNLSPISELTDTNLENLTIDFITENNGRYIFQSNFNYDTLAWYTGVCAATIAGSIATYSLLPWVKAAGVVAAVAGASAISSQIAIWLVTDEVQNLYNSIKINNYAAINQQLKKDDFSVKLGIIGTATVTTLTACTLTPIFKTINSLLINQWKKLVDLITVIIKIFSPKGQEALISNLLVFI